MGWRESVRVVWNKPDRKDPIRPHPTNRIGGVERTRNGSGGGTGRRPVCARNHWELNRSVKERAGIKPGPIRYKKGVMQLRCTCGDPHPTGDGFYCPVHGYVQP